MIVQKDNNVARGMPSALLARTFLLDERAKNLSNDALAVYWRLLTRQAAGLTNPASYNKLGAELRLSRKDSWTRVITLLTNTAPPLLTIEGGNIVVAPFSCPVSERVRVAQRNRAIGRWKDPKSTVTKASVSRKPQAAASTAQLGLIGLIDGEASVALAAATKESGATVPAEEIVKLYHEICVGLPRVHKIAGASFMGALNARWNDSASHRNLEFWRHYFTTVAERDFLMGRNDKGFRADFTWLVRKSAFENILNGRYANSGSRKPTLFGEGAGKQDESGHEIGDSSVFQAD